jgi:hypothetical protein
MNKILAALVAATFSLGAFAQTSAPAAKPATAPVVTAAAPAPELKKDAPVKKTKHAKAKRATHAKKAASAA